MSAIARRVEVGMSEEEALEIANQALATMGADKKWHRSRMRFGENTLKPYGEPSAQGVRLREDDLFFVDIGPVWDGYEGDAGATFVLGHDAEMWRCVAD